MITADGEIGPAVPTDRPVMHRDRMNAAPAWWTRPQLVLLAILLFAAGSRLAHLAWDQNHYFHPDERAVAFAVGRLSFRPLQLDPDFFAYGSLPIYLAKITSSL